MKISIIGAGRVGLCLGASLAKSGFPVLLTDKDSLRGDCLKKGELPFYEPGLEDLLGKYKSSLKWTEDREEIISSDMIFFTLSTPVKKNGDFDLSEVFKWCEWIVSKTRQEKYLIIKSTFPLGTNEKIHLLTEKQKVPLHVLTCPEFLRQGEALRNISFPDRLVIGARDLKSGEKSGGILQIFFQRTCFSHHS